MPHSPFAVMLTLEAAIEQIRLALPQLPGECVALADACGRISLDRVTSTVDLPRFDSSAMDGYALRAVDLAGASAGRPVALRVAGCVAAGEVFEGPIAEGDCVRIFTGSPLPEGADAVVMQEDTLIDPDARDRVWFLDSAQPWENVRIKGEDIKTGSVLIEPGQSLEPGRIGLLAAAGANRIVVSRKPVVGLLATGSELIEGGSTPQPGQIHESNRPMLAALCGRAGAVPVIFPLVRDSLAETESALAAAMSRCDVVVSSGGVSVGEFDFVKEAFKKLGGRWELWRVAIKPGKPFAFGRFQERVLFGLPGNPVSAFVTFQVLVRAALLGMQGATNTALPTSTGTLAEEMANPGDRRHFLRVVLSSDGSVKSAGAQSSHVLGSLAAANGLLDVPPRTRLPEGARVSVLRMD